MRELRDRIDAVDRTIVGAFNERLELVRELWQLKRELGLDRLDPGREEEIRRALRAANGGPLTEEGLDELIDAILALTKREGERR